MQNLGYNEREITIANKILLVLTNTRISDESINTAIRLVKEQDTSLTILFVIDEERSAQSVINKLVDEGWMGGKASEDLYNTIENEYKFFGEAKIKEIEKLSAREGINHETIVREGNLISEVLKTIEQNNIEIAIIPRRKRTSLSRFIFGSSVEEIQKQSNCQVMIIDE